ncbi:MAG TPA: DUF4865 family protein [Pseudonocardiaceae bacterium]|nr:DUF4865 family protein [Pseudonocardiaceae bacterium]
MYAVYYDRVFPADYDMGIIRKRVANVGHLLDDRAGMFLKAYLIRERGIDGAPVNQVSSCYLWEDSDAMAEFFFADGGFFGVIRDFGRPTVEHWMGVATVAGPARGAEPRAASRRITVLPESLDQDGLGLARRIEVEKARLAELADNPDLHTAAIAVDPRDWRLLRLTLWAQECPADDDAEHFEVMHLSAPGITEARETARVRDAV